MTLTSITMACNGQLYGTSYKDREIAGVVMDSRKVEKDFLFIATVGERVDGHNFISKVFDKGAIAVVCEKAPADAKGPYILVDNSFTALKDIAKYYRMQLNIKVVGITGSVGKTSTKEFVGSVLSEKYNILKTEGNYNNEVGLPLTILKIRESHQIAVLEMGISDFGEMHRLSEIARPDICVLTNIGQCHLENLGSRAGILKAKTEIFDFMSATGSVCINGDDDMLSTIGVVKNKLPIKFGINKSNSKNDNTSVNNDVYATNVLSNGLFGSTCDIHITDKVYHVTIPLPGEHMVLNALAAASVGTLLSMTGEEITAGIKNVQPVGGRSNIIRQDHWTIIDDCYNANPVSMKAAIDLLCLADSHKVAILGDMFELGTSEKKLHKEVGVYASSKNIDILICVGSLSLNIYEGASEHFEGTLLYYKTREELIEALPSIIQEKDTILVKASHGMGFEQIVQALQ